jgi:hypothetical protein
VRSLTGSLRGFGVDIAPAGNGEVLVSTIDDNAYLFDAITGVRRRTFVAPGGRTPVEERPIAAVGRYVLSGDPNNHTAAGISWAGAVHVFDRATGARLRTLVAPDPVLFGGFGRAVAALGGQALIAQADRVFVYDTTTWTPVREFAVGVYSPVGNETVAPRPVLSAPPSAPRPARPRYRRHDRRRTPPV